MNDFVESAPWLLTVAERTTGPVLLIKERVRNWREESGEWRACYSFKMRGQLSGPALRRILPVIRQIIERVCDPYGIPLELHRHLGPGRISFWGNLPLDEEAGVKLALLFKLLERVPDLDRAELIARRVERFTREEAAYWLTRATQFGKEPNRWALAGMRVMLGGKPGDPGIGKMLDRLRAYSEG